MHKLFIISIYINDYNTMKLNVKRVINNKIIKQKNKWTKKNDMKWTENSSNQHMDNLYNSKW